MTLNFYCFSSADLPPKNQANTDRFTTGQHLITPLACFFSTASSNVIESRSRGSLLVLTGIKREFWGVVSSSCTCYKGGNRSTLEIYFNLIDRRWRDKCPSYFSSPTQKKISFAWRQIQTSRLRVQGFVTGVKARALTLNLGFLW